MSKIEEQGLETQQLLDELEVNLKTHDWWYDYSDDRRYWKSGRKEREVIISIMNSLKDIGKDEEEQSKDLWHKYMPDKVTKL
tara:strand:- start:117 stop:362 length:246 start_codon:yes stop_codon:yes gene_type:complete